MVRVWVLQKVVFDLWYKLTENAAMKSDIQTLLDNRQQHQSLFQTYIPGKM